MGMKSCVGIVFLFFCCLTPSSVIHGFTYPLVHHDHATTTQSTFQLQNPVSVNLCRVMKASFFLPNTVSVSRLKASPEDDTTTTLSNSERRSLSRRFVAEGMESFRKGDVPKSIDLFNQAENMYSAMTPYLWQRGLSYYYVDDYDAASKQFRIDVNVNPSDVEEIVWDIASSMKGNPNQQFPPTNMMSLPPGVKDRRRIMPTVYKLFRGEGNEHDLALAGHSGSAADEFYALFYLGLFCESVRGETSKAKEYMRQAVRTNYATGVGRADYMTSVARVHCKLRGWD